MACFRLRHVHRAWAHRLFRIESELNTILFAGSPGLVSKLWLRHDERHLYRGVYQWDGADAAAAYVRALWWMLRLVSEGDSIHSVVVPGLDRDRFIDDPSSVDAIDTVDPVGADPGDWWRPVG